jgi:hypothetical protein
MLPDFAEAQPHIRYVVPGEPDNLREELDRVASLPPGDSFFAAHQVRASVQHYTWQRFRTGIETVLAQFD